MKQLTGKQKSHLRGLAMTLKPVLQVGKEGITSTLLQAIDDFVKKNELLKLGILDAAGVTVEDIAAALAGRDIAVVQKIGKNVVCYRANPSLERRIELPR